MQCLSSTLISEKRVKDGNAANVPGGGREGLFLIQGSTTQGAKAAPLLRLQHGPGSAEPPG